MQMSYCNCNSDTYAQVNAASACVQYIAQTASFAEFTMAQPDSCHDGVASEWVVINSGEGVTMWPPPKAEPLVNAYDTAEPHVNAYSRMSLAAPENGREEGVKCLGGCTQSLGVCL